MNGDILTKVVTANKCRWNWWHSIGSKVTVTRSVQNATKTKTCVYCNCGSQEAGLVIHTVI